MLPTPVPGENSRGTHDQEPEVAWPLRFGAPRSLNLHLRRKRMRASSIEFRLRMLIQIVIVFFGFWAPWIGPWDLGRRISTLEWLPLEISRTGLASFTVASPFVIVAGALAALAGAVLRVWGAAYLGYRCCAPRGDAGRRGDGRRTLSLCAQSPLSWRLVHDGRRFASHAAHRARCSPWSSSRSFTCA